jgi:MFS family permease
VAIVGGAGSAPLAGLLALGVVVGTINGLGRVALPLYAASLGAHAWQVGIIGGLGYAGILLLALPMGAWIDRHGGGPLFLRGVVGAALLYLLLPWLRTPWQAIAAAALLGLLLPLRTIPVHTEFLALLPRLSPSRAGWNRAAHTVGMFFLGPAVAGALLTGPDFAPVFLFGAFILLLGALLGRRVLAGGEPQPDGPSLARRIRRQLALVRRHAGLRRTIAIDFLAQAVVAYFAVFGLILAVQRFGLPLQAAAGIVTLQGALYVFTLFAAGSLLVRWQEDSRYLLAFALLFAQCLLCGLATSSWGLWLGAALLGVGLGLQGLTSTSRFASLMSRYGRGRIGGLTSLGPPAGGVVGAMLGGAVSQRLGTEAGFLILALPCGLMCVAQVLRPRRHRAAA